MSESTVRPPVPISVEYNAVRLTGLITCKPENLGSAVWSRLKAKTVVGSGATTATSFELPWSEVLELLREFGTQSVQRALDFRFVPTGEAAVRIRVFAEEVRRTRALRDTLTQVTTAEEITRKLQAQGFVRRELRPFQLRDLQRLLALAHGANFSVPGAGKTSVTFALHLLTRKREQHLLVVGPKSAFPAWREVVGECMEPSASDGGAEPFIVLDGDGSENERRLGSGATRFLITYDLMIRQPTVFSAYLARQPVHLVLDEAHRIKAGEDSQRGALMLSVAGLAVRRDVLTGTPMPQGPGDLASQVGFLWPGHEYRNLILRGQAPRDVLGNLYVRTTKSELGLLPAKRFFHSVPMAQGQQALYGIVRNESLRQLTNAVSSGGSTLDFPRAKRSVMRLLQLSSNPVLALKAMAGSSVGINSGVVEQVLAEGPSTKMRAVADHARSLAREGRKVVIWTIFTETIGEMERMLADLNPVSLHGAVPSGSEEDLGTREGRIRRFHQDPACSVIIANPAAAGEGISLHHACHDAIYLDRSYVMTHYLQSIDRIHRLGLPPDVETNIHVYQTAAPAGLGSIDGSVKRRLAIKLRNLQRLLDDPDLHEVALDEENAIDPIDFDVDMQDLVDLVAELEGKSFGDTPEEE